MHPDAWTNGVKKGNDKTGLPLAQNSNEFIIIREFRPKRGAFHSSSAVTTKSEKRATL